MKIRKASIKDVEGIHNLGKTIDEFSVSKDTVNFWPKKILQNCIKSKSALLFVAEENEKLIGFIIVNYNPTFRKAVIENIFISPQYRERGIAKKLLEATFKKLRDIDCEYVCTLVSDKKAKNFYIKNGFKSGNKFLWMDKILSNNFERNSRIKS